MTQSEREATLQDLFELAESAPESLKESAWEYFITEIAQTKLKARKEKQYPNPFTQRG